METWPSNGNTGSVTGTKGDEELCFHGNKYEYQNIVSSTNNERNPSAGMNKGCLEQMDKLPSGQTAGAVNGNRPSRPSASGSRSSFRSGGSELTSDSDTNEGGLRRDLNPNDADVFLPLQPDTSEQGRILAQKRREIASLASTNSNATASHSWKRVAEYVNALPSILEPGGHDEMNGPGSGGGGVGRATQAKRQRIWSEGHSERRRVFAESSSQSFAEGMSHPRRITTSTSSNLSQLSSQWSRGSSQHCFESSEEFTAALFTPISPLPEDPSQNSETAALAATQNPGGEMCGTPSGVHLPVRPKALIKQTTFHHGVSDSESRLTNGDISPQDGSAPKQEGNSSPTRPRPLKRQLTNSELIALASQHRQQHSLHQRRQNLHRMGSSNVSDNSDTDVSAQSISSIDDLLIARQDPEEILLNLGFGGSPREDVLDRIPNRFLEQPSLAHGISVHAFLSQMDELERGCGFSLIGGLRGLGSALRRSSQMLMSPNGSWSVTPSPRSAEVKGQQETAEGEKNNNESTSRSVVFPDAVVVDHSSKRSGHEVSQVKGQSATGTRGQSEVDRTHDDASAKVESSQRTGDGEILSASVHRTRPVTLPNGLPPVAEEDQSSLSPRNKSAPTEPSPSEVDVNIRNRESRTTTSERRPRICDVEISTRGPTHERLSSAGKSSGRHPEVEANKEKGSPSRPRPLHVDVLCSAGGGGGVRLLDTREDSFEFEELSSEERLEEANAASHPPDTSPRQGRRGSTQSDSSGFSDEGIGSTDLASPHQATNAENCAKNTSRAKVTQTSFDEEEIELFESQSHISSQNATSSDGAEREPDEATSFVTSPESHSLPSVSSLEDSPFDDNVIAKGIQSLEVQRTRAHTYSDAMSMGKLDSGSQGACRMLSSLHARPSGGSEPDAPSMRKRHPKLVKMRSVDPEFYGYKRHEEPSGSKQEAKENEFHIGDLDANTMHEHSHKAERESKGNEGVVEKAKETAVKGDDTFANGGQVQTFPAQSEQKANSVNGPEHQVVFDKDSVHHTNDYMSPIGIISSSGVVEPEVVPFRTKREESMSASDTISSATSDIPSTPDRGCQSRLMPEVTSTGPVAGDTIDTHPTDITNSVHPRNQQAEDIIPESTHQLLSAWNMCVVTEQERKRVDSLCPSEASSTSGLSREIRRTLSDLDLGEVNSQTSAGSSIVDKAPFSAYSSSEFEVNIYSGDEERPRSEKSDSLADVLGSHPEVDDHQLVCEELVKPLIVESESLSFARKHSSKVQSSLPFSNDMQAHTEGTTLQQSMETKVSAHVEEYSQLYEFMPGSGDSKEESGDIEKISADLGSSRICDPQNAFDFELHVDERSADLKALSRDSSERLNASNSRSDDRGHRSCASVERSCDTADIAADISHSTSLTDGQQEQPVKGQSQAEMTTARSLHRSETRIEAISREEHIKAREELKVLLSSENDVSNLLPTPTPTTHDEAIEDLKLLQRALCRYHQDLDLLETWSYKVYQDLGYAFTMEERDNLGSLSRVRHQIKGEILLLEKSLMEKYQSVVTSAADSSDNEENIWSVSLSHVMCEMVRLLREQISLRSFLDDLDALDRLMSTSTSAPPSPLSRKEEEGSMAPDLESIDPNSKDASQVVDPMEEVVDLTNLSFPQVMTQDELVEELGKAQHDLAAMRVKAKHDVARAVREFY